MKNIKLSKQDQQITSDSSRNGRKMKPVAISVDDP